MPRARSLLLGLGLAVVGVVVAALVTALSTPAYRATTEVYFAPSATLDASAHARVASFAAVVDGQGGVRARVLPDSLVVRLTTTADDAAAARTAVAAASTALQERAASWETSARGLTPSVVAPAGTVTRLARPWLRNLLLGLGVGALLGALAATRSARRARRLRTGADVARAVPTWAVDAVPVAGRTAALVRVADPAGIYERLAGGLRYLDVDAEGTTLVLAGARTGHDATEVAVRVGTRLATDGGSVVLVDAALDRPEVAEMLGLDEGRRRGLTSVLAGDDRLDDALQVHHPSGLAVLPAGPAVPMAGPILSSRALERLVADLRRDHTTVLVVTDALDAGEGAAWVAGAADGVVLVLRQRRDTDRRLVAAAEAVETHGGSLRAVVLTHFVTALDQRDEEQPTPAPVAPLPAAVIPAQREPDPAERLGAAPQDAAPFSLLEDLLAEQSPRSAEPSPAEPSPVDTSLDEDEPLESIWRPRAR